MNINRQELFKSIGYLGAGLLAAGYIRYTVQEVLGRLNGGLLIAGAVLLAASLILNFNAIRDYFRGRGARLGANTAVLTVAFLAILGIVNYLGYRHHKRIDVTAEKLYSLSDQTRKVVSGLQRDVKVIQFAKDEDPEMRDRMAEYRDLSRRLTFERVDPQQRPEVARQYNISRMGEVIVSSGDRVERPAEAGEQELTNAILKVTRDKLKTVCFVEGHGEKAITSTEATGYEYVDRMLKNENYQTKSVNLVTAGQVPSECEVLVLAGPKQALFPQEAAIIGKYLDGGGKALLELDPDTAPGLGDVLKAWNIELGDDTVLDVSGVGQLIGAGPAVPLALNYGSHPITKDFQRSMTFFPLARSVKIGTASKPEVTTTDLLKTSEASWGETELKSGVEPKLDEGKDLKGPVTLGAAASRRVGEKEARLVVIGDSDFATNNYARIQRNGDLFMNTVNWLAQDEDLIAIRPKSPTDRRVTMSEGQQTMLFWLTVFLMPLAVIGTGAYVWWKRK
jgi:gliding motility-associatede transport system auxiliary component